jgi:GT2 family glycosyltransferase
MNFCILIPTINRADLLLEALPVYKDIYPNVKVYILDNGDQAIPNISPNFEVIIPKPRFQGVSASWNMLIEYAIHEGHENFLILNDDIILKAGQGAINQIIERWGPNTFHRPRAFYNWSAFLLNKTIYDKVGEFDENFKKAFFEDNDYEYRMKCKNITIRYEDALNAEVYRNSMTIQKDPLLGDYISNREYYIRKWGGLPNEETYKTPFNEF